jgi:hypothetical protein
MPWAKIMVLLHDLVEQAKSQYDMKLGICGHSQAKQKHSMPGANPIMFLSTNTFIMTLPPCKRWASFKTGSRSNFETFFNLPVMDEAWQTYMSSGMNAPIGMSLYAIQLIHVLALPNEFMAIQSEKLMQETDKTYGKVLNFLGFERISLQSYTKENSSRKTKKTNISLETETLLRQVFAPFNQKLGETLGREWGGVWETE